MDKKVKIKFYALELMELLTQEIGKGAVANVVNAVKNFHIGMTYN
jgi:hypothetical protein